MKVPKCFVDATINGSKMKVWRPTNDQTWAASEPIPTWKQVILALLSKPTHVVPIDSKPVKLNLVRVRVLSKDKQEEAFELDVEDDTISVGSPLFGDGDDKLEFTASIQSLECKLPWEEDYDFEIDWKDDKQEKHQAMVLQVLHYMGEWFGDDISSDVCADFEQDNESSDSDDDEKDYTFAEPWVLALDKTSKIQGKCTNHDEEITYVFDSKNISCLSTLKRSRDAETK